MNPGELNPYWYEENKKYPINDWKTEVWDGDTRLGYWDWVEAKIESEVVDE